MSIKRIMQKFLLQSDEVLSDKYHKLEAIQKQRLYDAGKNPTNSEFSYIAASSNESRNKYSNVFAYDKTRFTLKTVSPEYSDYINANNIELKTGSSIGNYIATQGPSRKTYEHFWYMCHQACKEQIVIVMLTPLSEGGKQQCFKYWSHSDFKITNEDGLSGGDELLFNFKHFEENDSFQLTEWELTDSRGSFKKQVVHFYYDKWEDFKAADSSEQIIELSERVHSFKKQGKGNSDPIIAHCAAGVGRTGTFLTIDYFLNNCLDYLKISESGEVKSRSELKTPVNIQEYFDPIYNIVEELRNQRIMMVQRFQQFTFIYDTIKKFYIENSVA